MLKVQPDAHQSHGQKAKKSTHIAEEEEAHATTEVADLSFVFFP